MSKSKKFRILIGFISGILFGMGMVISGMADPLKPLGFLNITGDWDPSLGFVMIGALGVFIPFYHLLIKKRKTTLSGDQFICTINKKLDKNLFLGAAIFGIGWGTTGICPGAAIANILGGSNIILAYILCMIIGIVLGNQYLHGRLPLPFLGFYKKYE